MVATAVASLTETFDFFWDLDGSLLAFDFRFEALGGINATELVVCTDEGPLAVLSIERYVVAVRRACGIYAYYNVKSHKFLTWNTSLFLGMCLQSRTTH